MENHQEHFETLEDIVFQNRNKNYGAYILRADYQNVIKKALIIGIGIFCLAILTPMLWAKVDRDSKTVVIADVLNMEKPPIEEVKPIEPVTPPPPVEPEPQVKSQIRFTEPEIVDDSKATELPPDQDVLSEATNIGTQNIVGVDEPIPTEDPDASKGSQPEMPVAVKTEESNQIFTAVEQNPEFMGGMDALTKFLQKNLRYPTPAVNANVGGKVYMQFVVGQDGSITRVDILKGIGFGCDEEAQRVVKLMPRWSPGKQSGRPVAVRYTLPISFQLSE
ncbi:energy transducer TonB [Arcicella sp. LKC2W]|uniref:energy transducer TonB n=1 Tax=Arcicella sp. LKC2W TaxID=2984198 RepID=UPI002B1EF641|nr:energy transducer TonB [Arcicella sp. LKC2W]MEA5460343.1 energy transducer TonB [Arcicella sp. LKC2W]